MTGSRALSIGTRTLSHVAVWFYAALLLLPLYFLVVSSLKDNTEIYADGFGLPPKWRWENYVNAWNYVDLGHALFNSAYVTVLSEILIIVLAVPAAYGVARSRGWIGKLVERSLTLGFLIPGFAALVPTVLLAIGLGLFRTREFLILDYVAGAMPLSVILLAQYVRALPHELEESARVDGANRLQILWRIYLPLIMPALATVMLLNFINIWNEYLIALVIGGPSVDIRTAQVALPTLVTNQAAQFGLLTAGTVIVLIPVYLCYLALRKRMENALVSGALKG
ncbi:carbohydrate ABC transporter permease [Herbiconiux moechotypicola]|uniref:Carbohydrate ABC transporter permease n=1 Tax=Herbiconiux moechotypicola TaxID=637393 RepID=A0ABP5QBH6_9MICO|nr:carbohydrate ABC transporter permease [Herbiconiux moechotypicola]MCS5729601.1 carbohydrate ABC transporter permease [Herbiconiux moechotypicola]